MLFNPVTDVAWGDVAVNSHLDPHVTQIHKSKCHTGSDIVLDCTDTVLSAMHCSPGGPTQTLLPGLPREGDHQALVCLPNPQLPQPVPTSVCGSQLSQLPLGQNFNIAFPGAVQTK